MITDIIQIVLDNTEKITLQFKDWEILFHTLYTEQFLSTLINIYNTLSVFIPEEEHAVIQINPSALSHSTISDSHSQPPLTSLKDYSNAMITMYAWFIMIIRYRVSCNKYGTQPLEDVELDLQDKIENGCKKILIDNRWRVVDAPQAAAIIESLIWDKYVETR